MSIIDRLKEHERRERCAAGGVQGPAFRRTEWGADIIGSHHARADDFRDAATLINDLLAALRGFVKRDGCDGECPLCTFASAAIARAERRS